MEYEKKRNHILFREYLYKVVTLKKKSLYIISIFIIPIIFIGCTIKLGSYSINNFTVTKKKPNNYYYTNLLIKNLVTESKVKGELLDTNFSKEADLSKEDIETIKKFSKSIKKANFIEKPKDLSEKPQYKLFLDFDKEKFVINIYNERYIAVYPWDGTYSMDYVDMEGIQPLYNLYGLCKFLIPR
ncbi:hypothetical protein HMPREF1982_03505 [Clostridiales bacterium oral taxon 876 str. F0540]|nr:hypothetical protein HMPREF1982_03505 [Clostridiales bacterium oral taxon 876 str. F0540]